MKLKKIIEIIGTIFGMQPNNATLAAKNFAITKYLSSNNEEAGQVINQLSADQHADNNISINIYTGLAIHVKEEIEVRTETRVITKYDKNNEEDALNQEIMAAVDDQIYKAGSLENLKICNIQGLKLLEVEVRGTTMYVEIGSLE